jgi:hypothetical protein
MHTIGSQPALAAAPRAAQCARLRPAGGTELTRAFQANRRHVCWMSVSYAIVIDIQAINQVVDL